MGAVGRVAGKSPGAEGDGAGGVEQATSVPTISAVTTRRRSVNFMGLILLEALLALVVLIAIVWWTMFSGRKGGELDLTAQDPNPEASDDRKPPTPGG
jgi:hypothetical protein